MLQEACYRGRYRRMYDYFETAALSFQPTVPKGTTDVLALGAGFDPDGGDWLSFRKLWNIREIDLTPGVPGGLVYGQYQPVINFYWANRILLEPWEYKCPVFALRSPG